MSAQSFSALFARWKEADALARAAEEHILSASMQALERDETLPSVADWAEVKRLRADADALLDQAIAQMRREETGRSARRAADDASGPQCCD
jgi:hypothetical protein